MCEGSPSGWSGWSGLNRRGRRNRGRRRNRRTRRNRRRPQDRRTRISRQQPTQPADAAARHTGAAAFPPRRLHEPRDEHLQPRGRGEAARRTPDEAHRHRPAAARRRGLRPRQVGARTPGAGAWAGYVAAAAEAGMVGALADWFAVTALFRHPLGLPIPHTAIIPTKKDQLGVSPRRVRRRELPLRGRRTAAAARRRHRQPARRLARRARARRPGDRRAGRPRCAARSTVLRDSDVQAVVGEAITRRADAQEIAPGIGKMLERIVADGGHRRAVDLVVRPRPRLAGAAQRLGDGRRRRAARPAGPRGSSTARSASASTRNCCASSPRCATCPPTRRAAPSTASSPTSPPTSSPTPTPGRGSSG